MVTQYVFLVLRTIIQNHFHNFIGGSYVTNLQKNHTSLLVVPSAGGDKHKFAVGWKVPCVKPEWVEACKSAGHVVSLKDFLPKEIEGKKEVFRNKKSEEDLGVPVSTPMCSMGKPFILINYRLRKSHFLLIVYSQFAKCIDESDKWSSPRSILNITGQ
jgi:hypothetical protein